MSYLRYTKVTDCAAVFAKANPTERKQILAFVKANTEAPLVPEPFGYWSLIRMINSGTGKEFTTVSMRLEKLGITAEQIREVVGLPKLVNRVVPAPTPSKRRITKGGCTSA